MVFGKTINRYYVRYAWMLLLGLAALVAVDVGQLKLPELYRLIVNGLNTGFVEIEGAVRPFDLDVLLDHVCGPLCLVILMVVTGRFLWRVGFFGSAIRMEKDLRLRMFDHCKDLSQQYYQRNKVGNLMSLFTNDLETVQECFGNGFLTFFDALIMGSLALVKMFRMNALLSLFSMLPMGFLFVCASLVGKKMSARWRKRQEAFSALSDFSQESFSGIAVIKAFAREALELSAFKRLNRDNEDANVSFVRMSTLMNIMITLFVESVICVILGYGGYLVHEGVFDAGRLVEFIGYFTSVVWPIMAISMLIDLHARGSASLERITELLDAPVDVKDGPRVKEGAGAAIRGGIEFRSLSFSHPGSSAEALHDVSFKIEPGENIGLIGRTGCGKTTVVDLIARIYNVPDGTVFVDGRDVNTVPIRELRRAIAYVPQDNFLFSDTIAENIAFAFDRPDDMDAVRRAAVLADVDGNISEFPDGYMTVLGERGTTVSGGQKQRISIARALMKDAPILILDDSVSAVDTRTEKTVLDNLRRERQGRTTILIAHRVSTVERMDRVLFMDEGRVLDFGTHQELMERCPAYRQTVELQRLEDEKKERE